MSAFPASTKATFSELPQQSPRNTLNPIKILAENSGDISPLKGDFLCNHRNKNWTY